MGKNISAKKIIISALIFSFLVLPVFVKAEAAVHLRIEGENNNICDANVTAETALDAVEKGAGICNYTYSVQDYDWGAYLEEIKGEAAHGSMGWLYFVNYEMPMVGAGDYVLAPGDEVLWAFGDFDWEPTRLTLANTEVEAGNNLEAKVEYFEDSSWKPLAGAVIYVDSQTFTTDAEGKADLVINNAGTYQVFAQKSGYIRSNSSTINVNAAPAPSPSGPAPFGPTPAFSGGAYYLPETATPTPTSTSTSTPAITETATSTPETAAKSTGMVAGIETNAQVESLQTKIAEFQTQIIKITELQTQLIQLLQQLIQELQAQVLELQS